jgi:hypothetical protein
LVMHLRRIAALAAAGISGIGMVQAGEATAGAESGVLRQGATAAPGNEERSRFEIAAEEPLSGTDEGEIVCAVTDSRTGRPLPARVIVKASDGKPRDGAGRGLYNDGRFFADSTFTVRVPAGATEITLRSGPNYVPLTITVTASRGKRIRLKAQLYRWFSPEEHGWYGGESHVHTKHDRTGTIQMDGKYTALQARAQGLSFLSQASKGSADEDPAPLSTPDFLFRNAAELGGGPFIGHLTTPGITSQVPESITAAAYAGPLPVQALLKPVHERGGIITYTHPLAPPYQLHWMGATEAYSDAVMRRSADAFDIDSRATELVWFGLLNLGNRIAASSYTDSALERVNTLSPGDRRVYSHAREFTYPAIIQALREGRTFATNGGPIFPFFTVENKEPGETLSAQSGRTFTARATVHSLYPLREAYLYRRGKRVQIFPVTGKKGEITLTYPFTETEASWYVLRVEDERGNWAITSPVYFTSEASTPPRGNVVMLEIGNHARYTELRRDFFAHLIVTVSPEERLREVQLLKDGQIVRRFTPGETGKATKAQTPVTGGDGGYDAGWVWHPASGGSNHFQADWPVKESGWYSVRVTTEAGSAIASDAMHFEVTEPNSHQLSVAHFSGPDFQLTRWGYGEEMPLADIRLPFEGDHWWYPNRNWWRLKATFGGETQEVGGGDEARAKPKFRAR